MLLPLPFASFCFCRAAVDEVNGEGSLPLRASAFLLLATLCAVLGVRAFPRLPRFFPAMLEALEMSSSQPARMAHKGASSASRKGERGGDALLWTSALSAVATVAASLPSFLSPYIGRILAIALSPACSAGAGKQAADRVLSLLSAGVESRLLIPAVCGAYAGCVEGKLDSVDDHQEAVAARSVARLLSFVQEVRGTRLEMCTRLCC